MRSVRRALRELERNDLASKGEPPINLVPMIDIMTVLVLYLLVATLQKHISVLELNMPTTAPVQTQEQPKLQLSVTVRAGEMIVSDRYGAIQRLPNNQGYDFPALAQLLVEIKRKAPEESAINLLLEPAVQYDVLVQAMDAVRLWPPDLTEEFGSKYLFPDIALGDAPDVGTTP